MRGLIAGSGFGVPGSGLGRVGTSDSAVRRAADSDVDDDSGQGAIAERHEHARADDGQRVTRRARRTSARRAWERVRRRNEAHRRATRRRGRSGRWSLPAEECRAPSSSPPRLRACARAAQEKRRDGTSGSACAPRKSNTRPRSREIGSWRVEQRLRREGAERDDHLRLNRRRSAGTGTARTSAISSGSGLRLPGGRHLMHVGDVDLVAPKADRLDHLRQQLAGAADERHRPGCLRRRPAPRRRTSARRRVADAEHHLLPASVCSLQRVHSPMSSRIAGQGLRRRPHERHGQGGRFVVRRHGRRIRNGRGGFARRRAAGLSRVATPRRG